MRMRRAALAGAVACCFLASGAAAQTQEEPSPVDSPTTVEKPAERGEDEAEQAGRGLRLYSLETEFLELIWYDPAHEYLVPHLARCFENSLRFHRELFDYTPSEKITILLTDFSDLGHAGTTTLPWNYITVGIEPFDQVYETMPANERMNWLMHHELVHIVATDQGAGIDNRFRSLYVGKVVPTADNPISMIHSFLTSPRWYAPRWYQEGIAVFLETWMSGGMGRVLSGYDEMTFRTLTLEDGDFYDVVGLESEGTTIDFQVGQNSYLYGTRFVTWLALEHGPETVIAWFRRTEGSKRYFSAQFAEVYGVPLEQEWRRWIAWEREWQARNVAAIREFPVTEDRPIATRAAGSVSRAFYDEARGRVYAAVNYPGETAHIAAIDVETGRMTKVADVVGPTLYSVASLAYDAAGTLFFTTDNTRGWRDLNRVDVATGRRERLIENFRAGSLVVNPADRSLLAVQHHNGLSTLIRVPEPYREWQNLLTLPYGKELFDLDVSPDGTILTAGMSEVSGRQRLVELEIARLLAGDGSYRVLVEFETNSPQNFVFSPDGRYLYGSSYYSGVSNLFRYDRESGALEALTNAETGYFRPIPVGDDRLIAFRYTTEGFLPVTLPIRVLEDVNAIRYLGQQVVETHPEVTGWNAGSPLRVDLAAATLYEGRYRPGGSVELTSIYPVVEGYKDTEAYGVRFNLSDPVGLHSMDVTAAVSPYGDLAPSERLHLDVEYRRYPWTFSVARNGSDFFDLFGPTKTSRKGTAASVTRAGFLINERPKTLEYRVNVAGYWGLDALPDFQNVVATVENFGSAEASLTYENFRRTIGSTEAEKGLGASLSVHSNYVSEKLQTRVRADVDYGLPLGVDHVSLWLRGSAGHSFGDRDSPFANFYFGGFGNNWVDHLSARRFREHYAFPGFDLNAIEAHGYAKLTAEVALPAKRFRQAGVPGFYLNLIQPTLFTSGVTADPGSSRQGSYGNVGAQLDLRLVMFSNLESTLSFGYAVGFAPDGQRPTEFMASLKILR